MEDGVCEEISSLVHSIFLLAALLTRQLKLPRGPNSLTHLCCSIMRS